MTDSPEVRNGWMDLAGALLLVVGVSHLVFGVAAIAGSERLTANVTEIELSTGLSMYASLGAWGWILVFLAGTEAIAGVAVWRRAPVAALVGLVVAYTGLLGSLLTFAIIRLPSLAFVGALLFAIYLMSYSHARHGPRN